MLCGLKVLKKKPIKAPVEAAIPVSSLQESGTVQDESSDQPATPATGPRQAGARRSKERTRRGKKSSTSS
jgi:hypothetical protein